MPSKNPAAKKSAAVQHDLSASDLLKESVIGAETDENTGLPRPTIVKKNRNWVKQVLFNSNGYVKPNEMVAILGPSGSGKTSLLNVISQRTGLSQASYAQGKVSINNR